MITRIAPTPSGYLHTGNALNMLLIAHLARKAGMKLLLRIDDMDAARKRPDYVADIFETLDWLKISIDMGPSSPDDFERHWSQHHRLEQYQQLLDALVASGGVYGCPHSRAAIAAASTDGQYPLALRNSAVPLHTPAASWRLRTDAGLPSAYTAFDPGQPSAIFKAPVADVFDTMRDFVVRRRDGLPAYQLCSIADDGYFGVTHIIRGADLLPSTAAQTLLLRQLHLPEPAHWHHPLLLGEDGLKLSKSAGAAALFPQRTAAMRDFLLDKVRQWME